MVEQKAFQGMLWVAFGMEQFARKMLERFTIKKAWARSVLVDAGSTKRSWSLSGAAVTCALKGS